MWEGCHTKSWLYLEYPTRNYLSKHVFCADYLEKWRVLKIAFVKADHSSIFVIPQRSDRVICKVEKYTHPPLRNPSDLQHRVDG
jgi:hypothetical protein